MSALERRGPSAPVLAGRAWRFATLVGVVLVVLKLAGAIGLSWWLVLFPFYAFPALIVLAVVAASIVGPQGRSKR